MPMSSSRSASAMAYAPACLPAGVAGIDREHLTLDGGAPLQELFHLANERPARTRLQWAHAMQRGDRVEPHDAVGLVADVALELPQGPIGRDAEQTVLLARIEPPGR